LVWPCHQVPHMPRGAWRVVRRNRGST
jgi:hypothetical protein